MIKKINLRSVSKADFVQVGAIGGVLLLVVFFGYMLFGPSSSDAVSSQVGGAPGIESLPGVGDPSIEYSKRCISEWGRC